jgi:hypothetical protein
MGQKVYPPGHPMHGGGSGSQGGAGAGGVGIQGVVGGGGVGIAGGGVQSAGGHGGTCGSVSSLLGGAYAWFYLVC